MPSTAATTLNAFHTGLMGTDVAAARRCYVEHFGFEPTATAAGTSA